MECQKRWALLSILWERALVDQSEISLGLWLWVMSKALRRDWLLADSLVPLDIVFDIDNLRI